MQITYEESFSKYLRKDGEITISDFNRYRISYMENKKRVRLNFKTQEEAINKILTKYICKLFMFVVALSDINNKIKGDI